MVSSSSVCNMKSLLYIMLFVFPYCICDQKIIDIKLHRRKGPSTPCEYYIKIKAGSDPEQENTLVVDTGSPHMWLLSENAKKSLPIVLQNLFGKRSDSMDSIPSFDGTKSSTFEKSDADFTMSYGDGTTTSGKVAIDSFKLGDTSLTLKDQVFGWADFISKTVGVTGFLGLGLFSDRDVLPFDPEPPLWGIIKQHPIAPEFSLFLNRFGLENEDNGGVLTFGGHSNELVDGEFTYHDVRKEWGEFVGWVVQLDKLTIEMDSKAVQDFPLPANTFAMADSGSNIIVGPLASIVHLHKAIFKNSDADFSKPFKFNCDAMKELPDVVFTIDGHRYVLNPVDYVTVGEGGPCRSLFMGVPLHPKFILGHPFMEKYYTKFDLKNLKIGFANAVSRK